MASVQPSFTYNADGGQNYHVFVQAKDDQSAQLLVRNATTGTTQKYKISIAFGDKPLTVQQESWKDIALAAVNVLHQEAKVALHSLKSADIYPYQQRLKYQQNGPGTVEEEKEFKGSQHFAKLAETIQKVDSVSRQPFQSLASLPLRSQSKSPPRQPPVPSPSALNKADSVPTQSPLSVSGLSARIESQPEPQATRSLPAPLTSRATVKAPTPQKEQVELPIFVDESGLSQHHASFRTPNYQLGKSKDGPVYFGTAACTPLAISFALSAKISPEQTDSSTPGKILNIIMNNTECLQRGKLEIAKMIKEEEDAHKSEDDREIALDRMNLNTTNGLRLYNAMKGTKHESTRSYYLSPLTSQRMACVSKDGFSEVGTWDQQFLKDDLKDGEGAVIIFGGYSVGVRRIGSIYEIFDSHSSESHTGQPGCCVVQCRTRDEFATYLNKIRETGPAAIAKQLGPQELDQYIQLQPAAFGVEILVF